MIYSIAEC